jgi:hypothetical protein
MKHTRNLLLIPLAMAGLALTVPSWGQNAPVSQERRADCQKQAAEKGLRSGPERQSFMRQCVHGSPTPPAAAAAQPATPAQAAKPAMPAEPAKPAMVKEPAKAPAPMGSMADCQKQADEKSLRGPDRKSFMRSCMHPR